MYKPLTSASIEYNYLQWKGKNKVLHETTVEAYELAKDLDFYKENPIQENLENLLRTVGAIEVQLNIVKQIINYDKTYEHLARGDKFIKLKEHVNLNKWNFNKK